jgi:hypothetical protein
MGRVMPFGNGFESSKSVAALRSQMRTLAQGEVDAV